LEERIFIRKRPVPEDCVAVASLDLLDRDEIFGCEILLKEAQVTLGGQSVLEGSVHRKTHSA